MAGVWAVAMMRDEADVAEACVTHMAGQGVDGIVVADNLSSDGTGDMLRDLAGDLVSPLVVVDDPEPGYFQSEKMTRLAGLAADRAGGVVWIVPFDADELWVAPDRRTPVADVLRSERGRVVAAAIYNHYPTGADDPTVLDPFRRMAWRDTGPLPLHKVAARWAPSLVIGQGNHSASYEDDPGPEPRVGLEVHHFPYRTPEQIHRKVRNGAAAYAATDLPRHMGLHWRELGETLERHGEGALDAHMDRWFRFDNPQESHMVHDPIV